MKLRIIIVIRPERVKVLIEIGDPAIFPSLWEVRWFVAFKRCQDEATSSHGPHGELSIVVGPENRISFADGLMPSVLATPWFVASLEYAARDALTPLFDANERSVGTFIEVEHFAPRRKGSP